MSAAIELEPNTITRVALDATLNQPMHRAYVAVGPAFCPECGARMNAAGWATWTDSVRTLWRCVNNACFRATTERTFARTTYIQENN